MIMSHQVQRFRIVSVLMAMTPIFCLPSHSQLPTDKLLFQDITISPNFHPDPTFLRGISGGTLPAITLTGVSKTVTGFCVGYLHEYPDHQLTLTEFFGSLRLMVESEGDTAIVVRGPGGVWCNDDFDGKNPGAIGFWLPGTYEIWVASYDQGEYYPYRIQLSEVELPVGVVSLLDSFTERRFFLGMNPSLNLR
jgi:hypothetical protein